MMRIVAKKNRPLLYRQGEQRIDEIAAGIRTRFATEDKHQIYSDKRDEARRFLAAVSAGDPTPEADYPYLYAEAGETAPTLQALAELWIAMNTNWRAVSAQIEKITVKAKKRIREADGQKRIDAIIEETRTALDTIGDKPPSPPGKDRNKPRPI